MPPLRPTCFFADFILHSHHRLTETETVVNITIYHVKRYRKAKQTSKAPTKPESALDKEDDSSKFQRDIIIIFGLGYLNHLEYRLVLF
jgi:hypothetical protein